jgi:hypothetical protein
MSLPNATIPEWGPLRTEESRKIEEVLRRHFQDADA